MAVVVAIVVAVAAEPASMSLIKDRPVVRVAYIVGLAVEKSAVRPVHGVAQTV